jgi:DNA-binding response OmpR family regulator
VLGNQRASSFARLSPLEHETQVVKVRSNMQILLNEGFPWLRGAAQKMADMTPSVLLVDDDALIQEMMISHLADAGFEIVAARNGTQALAELDADATRFKAVITDINLGTGPDGWDVGRHARQLVPTMPVVYISGDSGSEWSSQGVPDSVMITKPFAPAQLVTAVATLITSADTVRSASQDKA